MRIGHIELFVADERQAVVFYRDVLGFSVVAQAPGLAWVALDGTEILLRRREGPPLAAAGYDDATHGIVLYTDDLDGARATLEARGLAFRGWADNPNCPTFTDLDGNWFQLVDPDEDHSPTS